VSGLTRIALVTLPVNPNFGSIGLVGSALTSDLARSVDDLSGSVRRLLVWL